MSEIQTLHLNTCRGAPCAPAYRHTATNTGEHRYPNHEETIAYEKKLGQIQNDLTAIIDQELDKSRKAREAMLTKIEKIRGQIDGIVELHNNVIEMRQNLTGSEKKILKLTDKVDKIEMFLDNNYIKYGDNVIFIKEREDTSYKNSHTEEEVFVTLLDNDDL